MSKVTVNIGDEIKMLRTDGRCHQKGDILVVTEIRGHRFQAHNPRSMRIRHCNMEFADSNWEVISQNNIFKKPDLRPQESKVVNLPVDLDHEDYPECFAVRSMGVK